MKHFFTQRVFCFLFSFLFIVCGKQVFGYTITKFPAQTLCASTFPTAYVSGSFSIAETSVGEFTKNQTNKTIFFDLPAGWAYNTTAGTYSVTGVSANDITAITISAITTSRITVKLSVSNSTQIDMNTITVTCQIRASAAGVSSYIKRNGGTFRISKSSKKPTAAESLGNLSAQLQMAYVSSTVAQPNTSLVPQGTIDNDIIQVQLVITGTCSVFNATQFDFNTDGGNSTGSTNPSTDIVAAHVYYTGTNNIFSPIGLFGSINSPNGAFTITGTQALTAGTNYFWLVYDVKGPATAGNLLDAQCTSITMSGGVGAKTPTTQNPAGSRTIAALTQY